MELENKVVVITGGTRGLGKALALSFIKEGSKVVVCSNNKKELKNLPEEIEWIKADVTKEGDMEDVMKFTLKKFGGLDFWINNAGIWMPHLPVEQIDWERAHDLVEVNLFGTVYGSKVALAQMRKQNSGGIVNILSTSALEGKLNETAYCSSKFAAMGFTKSLRKEIEGTNIKVLAVYPGGMKTNLFDEKKPENYDEYMEPSFVADKIIENIKKEVPEEELILRRQG
jgi:uncharacterized protein